MYKLLIVEDEKWEREGLVEFLDWRGLDIEIVGAAANGIQGMKLAREYFPDIILTDIRMPIMDGMEFTRQIRQLIPGCRVIIITGYDDFEYAREAIRLGVFDFVLKPVKKDQLLEVLQKTVQNLNDERNEAEHVHILRRRLDERACEDRERLLAGILDGDLNSFMDREPAGYFNMPAFGNGIAAAVVKFDVYNFYIDKESGDRQSRLRELHRLARTAVGGDGIAVQNSSDANEIIICMPAESRSKNYIYDIIARIKRAFPADKAPEAAVGVGPAAKSLRGFADSFLQARAALDNLFFTDDCEILFSDDIILNEKNRGSEVYGFFASAAGYSKKVLNTVASSDTEGVAAISEELFEFIKRAAPDRIQVCNYLAGLIGEMSALLSNGAAMPNIGGTGTTGGDLPETLSGFIRLGDMKKWFSELLLRANRAVAAKKDKKEEHIVEKVMDIIMKEYKCGIGIETIAARLELSPNYLGSLFKKYVGKRFTEVLTDVRMRKAEELLTKGDGNILETAGEVGFVNAAHFCTVFKKTHGISPAEYRKKHLQKDI